MVYKILCFQRSYDMATVGAIASLIGTGYGIVQGQKQSKAQDKQLAMQRDMNENAKQTAKAENERADMEYNKSNRQTADVSAITEESKLMAKGGAAGTMLTGNMGVDPNELNLGGGSTLLG